MQKLEYILTKGAEIVGRDDQPLAPLAWELLDRLADDWGYPRYAEIGRYQAKLGSVSQGEVSYSLRDKETGVVVRGQGRDSESAHRNGLYQLRLALAEGQLEICWPKGESLHSPMCTCANNAKRDSNLAIGRWGEDEDDLERALGYSPEEIARMGATAPPGRLSRPSALAG